MLRKPTSTKSTQFSIVYELVYKMVYVNNIQTQYEHHIMTHSSYDEKTRRRWPIIDFDVWLWVDNTKIHHTCLHISMGTWVLCVTVIITHTHNMCMGLLFNPICCCWFYGIIWKLIFFQLSIGTSYARARKVKTRFGIRLAIIWSRALDGCLHYFVSIRFLLCCFALLSTTTKTHV